MGTKYKVGDVLDFNAIDHKMVIKIAAVKAAHYTVEIVDPGNCIGKPGEQHDYLHEEVENSPYLSLLEEKQKEPEKRFCNCEMLALMRTGCACGGV